MSQVQLAPLDSAIQQKEAQLRALLAGMGRCIIAYSGGVDSAFLLKTANDVLGSRAVGIIGISPSLMPQEYADAQSLADGMGVPLRVVETYEIDDEQYAANPANRCYFCKSHLFDTLRTIAVNESFESICDGTNVDDMQEWRPGAQAGQERSIRSPLREAGLTKAEIRTLSREAGLPTWDKPAMPCLSSRIPYGTPVTREALAMIGKAEAWLRRHGAREFRVRHHDHEGTLTARIEAAPEEMESVFALRTDLTSALRGFGYDVVSLDLEGYRRGKLNDKIAPQPVTLFLS